MNEAQSQSAGFPQQVTSEGVNYYNPRADQNALKIRLETEDIIERIEMYLRGESWGYNDKGELIKVEACNPKANEEGIRGILAIVTSYINKSVVQGNLTGDDIMEIMLHFKMGVANVFAFHCDEWGVNRIDRKTIIDFIEPLVRVFVSRPKDNKERESYGMTIRETGQQSFTDNKRSFGLFSRNKE